MKKALSLILQKCFSELFDLSIDFSRVQIDPPARKEFGDLATNASLVYCKQLSMNPRQLAEKIKNYIENASTVFDSVDIAGPGFINLKFSDDFYRSILSEIFDLGEKYGHNRDYDGKKVLLEFVSANPTGPLHIGHGRGAIVGDIVGNIMSANGYDVTREYYYNDAGVQMNNLGQTLRLRYLELLGDTVELQENHYHGDYMIDIARLLKDEVGDSWKDQADSTKFTLYAADHIIEKIDQDLKYLGISFDNWFSETSLHKNGRVDLCLDEMKEKGYAYPEDGAWFLKTTDYGDEKDRVVIKSDGNKTYLAPDIAYHQNKFERGFDQLVDVLGADHHGYIPRLKAGIQMLEHDSSQLDVIVIQMVAFKKDGANMKFSTRKGDFITLKTMIDELKPEVIRYFFAMRKADSQMVFDWDLARQESVNNPAFYIQYANARINSVLDKALNEGYSMEGVNSVDLNEFEFDSEPLKELLLHAAWFENVLRNAQENLAPHMVCDFLQEFAKRFHTLYNACRFMGEDKERSLGFLKILTAVQQVIQNGAQILGIHLPKKM